MLTRNEAQAAVHAVLEARSRLDPIASKDIFTFAIEMSLILDFPGDDPVTDIERWGAAWLQEHLPKARHRADRRRPVVAFARGARSTAD
jgi:hypothetical protein